MRLSKRQIIGRKHQVSLEVVPKHNFFKPLQHKKRRFIFFGKPFTIQTCSRCDAALVFRVTTRFATPQCKLLIKKNHFIIVIHVLEHISN